MKKKILVLMLMLPLVMTMLFSCKLFNKNKGDDGGENNNEGTVENLTFKKGAPPEIVFATDRDAEFALELSLALGEATGIVPQIYKGAPKGESESVIYIGRLDHEISTKAYERLERRVEEEYYEDDDRLAHVGFLYYSNGA